MLEPVIFLNKKNTCINEEYNTTRKREFYFR